MNAQKTHTIEGFEYFPCGNANSVAKGMRWYRRVQHEATGLYWGEQDSPQFATLAECREDAREQARYAACTGL